MHSFTVGQGKFVLLKLLRTAALNVNGRGLHGCN